MLLTIVPAPLLNQIGSTSGQVRPRDFHDHHFGTDDDSDATTESTGEDDLFLDDVAKDDKPSTAIPKVPGLFMDR